MESERISERTGVSANCGVKIAIQGEPGSFSHEAAVKLVAGAEIVPCALSVEVFASLDSGAADAAVIPIENSLAGSVLEHFDLLLKHDVKVVQETLLRIRHNLIAIAGVRIEEIEHVFSHPVALAQCRQFLAAHPRMKAVAFYDTAGSVKHLVGKCDRHAAAIASEAAARQLRRGDSAGRHRGQPGELYALFPGAAERLRPNSMPRQTSSASPSPSKIGRDRWWRL